MDTKNTVTGQRIFSSESDEDILAFLHEQLPQIREERVVCHLIGSGSIVVACVRGERGRVLAANLLPHKAQRERNEDILLQVPRDSQSQ
jgi:hypothetical protein